MEEICQRCGESDFDKRTLWMACFYEMSELDIPFVEITTEDKRKFYTLRVCKECRADWMRAIKEWFNNPPTKESCGSGIFIRENGGIKEVTEEEWHEKNPDRKPVRIRTTQ